MLMHGMPGMPLFLKVCIAEMVRMKSRNAVVYQETNLFCLKFGSFYCTGDAMRCVNTQHLSCQVLASLRQLFQTHCFLPPPSVQLAERYFAEIGFSSPFFEWIAENELKILV